MSTCTLKATWVGVYDFSDWMSWEDNPWGLSLPESYEEN